MTLFSCELNKLGTAPWLEDCKQIFFLYFSDLPEGDEDEVVIRKFPHLPQNYKALQDLKELIIKHQNNTSPLFLPTMMKLQQTYLEGQGSLRRRMVSCASTNSDGTTTENMAAEPENLLEMEGCMQILFLEDSYVLENIVLV